MGHTIGDSFLFMQSSVLLGAGTHQDLLQLLRAKESLVLSGASNETARAVLTAQFFDIEPVKCVYIEIGRAHV